MKNTIKKKECQKCGKKIVGHFNIKYCQKCKMVARKEAYRKFREKNPEKCKEANKKWLKKNPNYYKIRWQKRSQIPNFRQKVNEAMRKFLMKRRIQALEHYGGNPPKCACCGESEIKFLTIDHIHNDGAKHRQNIKNQNLPAWLYRNNYPKGFQVLCFNCNHAKGIYGECPHNNKQK